MKKKPIRIKDIARVLNISTSTVSRALRDTHDVNPYTKKQVLEVASQLGYKANVHAAALASGRTKNTFYNKLLLLNSYFRYPGNCI